MSRLTLLACMLLVLVPGELSAQEIPSSIAFPGSFWFSTGHVGPAEPGNVVAQAGFEQGVTVWERGSWFLVPYLGVTLVADSAGYAWNDRHPAQVALKLARRVPGGVVHAGGGVMFEHDPASDRRRHPTVFAGYWAGWAAEGRAQKGQAFGAFPGHAYASSGLLSGRDPDNWLTSVAAQQGMVVYRSRIVTVVPYAAGTLTVDSKRRVWENRLTYDAGVKVVRHFVGGVVEGGVAGRRQHELLTGRVESAPVAYVNLWIGWNPRSTSQR